MAPQAELFVVLPVYVERIRENGWIVVSVHRRKSLLNLCDAPTNSYGRRSVKASLEITRRREVVRMSVRFPAGSTHKHQLHDRSEISTRTECE